MIVPYAGDAQLRLDVPNVDSLSLKADQWVDHITVINRKKRRAVAAAACGDFRGYVVQFASDKEWLRYWALHCGKLALDATYTCGTSVRGRDDDVVYAMLASLRLECDV